MLIESPIEVKFILVDKWGQIDLQPVWWHVYFCYRTMTVWLF